MATTAISSVSLTVKIIFSTWMSGRQAAKTVHWTVRAVDNNNKLNNITNTSIVNSFPEPLYSAYQASTYVYPDWDSNIVRSGVILQDSGLNVFLLSFEIKTKVYLPVFGFAIIYEAIRDKAIIAPLEAAKNSGSGSCSYNVSTVAKHELEEIFSNSPEWYATTHFIGERVIIPIASAYIEGDYFKPILSSFVTGAAYVSQDLTRFRLIARDGKEIIEYLNRNPQCVFTQPDDIGTTYDHANDTKTDYLDDTYDDHNADL